MEKIKIIFLINKIHSVNTILGFLISIFFLFLIFFGKKINFKGRLVFLFPLIVSFLATFGSLFYSEYAGYNPCKLCWFQRIFMYPQTLLFLIAYFLNDKKVFKYSIVLSTFGLIIALYHYFLQFGIIKSNNCAVIGYSVSCVKQFVAEFGFVTIPLMASSAFLLLISYGLLVLKNQKNENKKNHS